MNRKFAIGAVAMPLGAAMLAAPALAHHSFAMFDNSRSVTLHGTVTSFQWTNPHSYLELDADDGHGGKVHYTFEMTSPNMMSRLGWTSRTIKKGDVVTVVEAPLRDGRHGGLLLEVTFADGHKMEPGVPNVERYKRT
jgi:hypothetical protein